MFCVKKLFLLSFVLAISIIPVKSSCFVSEALASGWGEPSKVASDETNLGFAYIKPYPSSSYAKYFQASGTTSAADPVLTDTYYQDASVRIIEEDVQGSVSLSDYYAIYKIVQKPTNPRLIKATELLAKDFKSQGAKGQLTMDTVRKAVRYLPASGSYPQYWYLTAPSAFHDKRPTWVSIIYFSQKDADKDWAKSNGIFKSYLQLHPNHLK